MGGGAAKGSCLLRMDSSGYTYIAALRCGTTTDGGITAISVQSVYPAQNL